MAIQIQPTASTSLAPTKEAGSERYWHGYQLWYLEWRDSLFSLLGEWHKFYKVLYKSHPQASACKCILCRLFSQERKRHFCLWELLLLLLDALGQPVRLFLEQGSTDCNNSKSEPGHLVRRPTLRHCILPNIYGARMYVQGRISFQGGLAVVSPNLRSDIIKTEGCACSVVLNTQLKANHMHVMCISKEVLQ